MSVAIYVRKGNKVLRVNSDEVDYYVNHGWQHITEDGKVIRENKKTYTAAEYNALNDELEALKKENELLKKKLKNND